MSVAQRLMVILSLWTMIFSIASCSRGDKVTVEMAAKGGLLFNSVGCTRCHSLSGDSMYGPALNFRLGQEITVIRNGRMKNIEYNRDYILRAMKDPDYEKLSGFEKKKMARIELPSDEIESIADYLIFINSRQK